MMDEMEKTIRWFIIGLIVTALLLLIVPAFADVYRGGYKKPPQEKVNVDVNQRIKTGDVESNSESSAEATAEANSDSSSEATATTGDQSINIDARTPGRSFIGGGDSTSEDQKVFAISGGWLTGNAAIRFDLTDKDARALRVAREWRALGLVGPSNKLQCSVKVVYKPFDTPEKCVIALTPLPPPPQTNVPPDPDMLMADITQQEYEEQQALVEDRYAQQQNKIASLEDARAEDDEEIEALKIIVHEALEHRDQRDVAQAKTRSAFKTIYERESLKAVVKETEDED